jgi:uncharacterized protein DUF4382
VPWRHARGAERRQRLVERGLVEWRFGRRFSSNRHTVSNAPRTCDLKKLNGPVDVLGVASLPAGKYTQIRLNVSTAAIYFDAPSTGPACAPSITPPGGAFEPVTIPSGEIKLNNEFTLAGAGTTITLDFDGDQSVRQTGGGNGRGNSGGTSSGKYMMSPVIRVVSVQ